MRKVVLLFMIVLLFVPAALIFSACDNSGKAEYFVIADTSQGKTLVSVTDKGSTQSKLSIPNGVEVIGKNAFLPSILSLVEINIPESVVKIEMAAFSGCINLESVNFDKSTKLEYIDDYAFSGCIALRKIEIPSEVNFGSYVFDNCSELVVYLNSDTPASQIKAFDEVKAVIVPNGKLEDYRTFYALIEDKLYTKENIIDDKFIFDSKNPEELKLFIGLEKNVTIPSTFTKLGDNCFKQNKLVNKISFAGNITSIGNGAFAGCSNLTEINIPASVTNLGENAFNSCVKLSKVDFAENSKLTDFEYGLFSLCYSLRSINIPDSVITIKEYAFNSCNYLTVTLTNRIIYIDNYAFYGVNKIYVKGYTQKPAGWNDYWAERAGYYPNYIYPNVTWNYQG